MLIRLAFRNWTIVNQAEAILANKLKHSLTVIPLSQPLHTSLLTFQTLAQTQLLISSNPERDLPKLKDLMTHVKAQKAALLPTANNDLEQLQQTSKLIDDLLQLHSTQNDTTVNVQRLENQLDYIKMRKALLNQKIGLLNYQFFHGHPRIVSLKNFSQTMQEVRDKQLRASLVFSDDLPLHQLVSVLHQLDINYQVILNHRPYIEHLVRSGFPCDNFMFDCQFMNRRISDKQAKLNKAKNSLFTFCLTESRKKLARLQKQICEIYGGSQKIYVSDGNTHLKCLSQSLKEQGGGLKEEKVWVVIGPRTRQFNSNLMQQFLQHKQRVFLLENQDQNRSLVQLEKLMKEEQLLNQRDRFVSVHPHRFVHRLFDTLQLSPEDYLRLIMECLQLDQEKAGLLWKQAMATHRVDHIGLRLKIKHKKQKVIKVQ